MGVDRDEGALNYGGEFIAKEKAGNHGQDQGNGYLDYREAQVFEMGEERFGLVATIAERKKLINFHQAELR